MRNPNPKSEGTAFVLRDSLYRSYRIYFFELKITFHIGVVADFLSQYLISIILVIERDQKVWIQLFELVIAQTGNIQTIQSQPVLYAHAEKSR